MTERQTLESTYWDTYVIWRRKNEKDPITKQTRQTEELIADNIPCALSANSGRTFVQQQIGDSRGSYTLFCAPETEIRLGDKIVVITKVGQTFTLRAGKPMRYASSAQIPMEEWSRADENQG